jgi:hypothetical protein
MAVPPCLVAAGALIFALLKAEADRGKLKR